MADTLLDLVKLSSPLAAGIAAQAELSPKLLAMTKPEMTAREYLEILLVQAKFADVVRFLIAGLPREERIWWATLAVRLASKPNTTPEIDKLLGLCVAWLQTPDEEHRKPLGELPKSSDAFGFLAKSIAWTGGSLTPPNLPVVPPQPQMSPKAAAAAIQLAAVLAPAPEIEPMQRKILSMGIRIARGLHPWKIKKAQTAARPAAPPVYAPGHPPTRPPY
jgi:hypothetical protein